jgi:hypothetical protein
MLLLFSQLLSNVGTLTCDGMKTAHCGEGRPCMTIPSLSASEGAGSPSEPMRTAIKTRYLTEGCCEDNADADAPRAHRDVCYPFAKGKDGVFFTKTSDYLMPNRVWLWEAAAADAEEISVDTSSATGQEFLTIRRPDYCASVDEEHRRIIALPESERKQHLCVPNSDTVQFCEQTFSGFAYPGFNTYTGNFVLGVGARREENGEVSTILAQPSESKSTVTVEFDVVLASDRYQQLFEIVFSLDEQEYGRDAEDVQSFHFETMHNRVEHDFSGPLRNASGVKRSMAKSNYPHETGLGNARKRTKAPSILLWVRANKLADDAQGNPTYGKEMDTVRLQVNDYLLAPTQVYNTDANGYNWIETTVQEYASLYYGASADEVFESLKAARSGNVGDCVPDPDPFAEALKDGKRNFTVQELVDTYMNGVGQTYASLDNVFVVEEDTGAKRYFYSPLRSAPPYTQSPGNMGTVTQLQKRAGMPSSRCSETECVYHLKVEVDYATIMNELGVGSTRLLVDEQPICGARIGVCLGQEDCDDQRAGATYFSPSGSRVWSPWPVGHNVTMIDGVTTIVQKGNLELPENACALPISSLFAQGPQAVFLSSNGADAVSIANLTSHSHSVPITIPFPFPDVNGQIYKWANVDFWNGRLYSDGTTKVFDTPLSVGDVLRQSHLDTIHTYGTTDSKSWALPNLDPVAWIKNDIASYSTFAAATDIVFG